MTKALYQAILATISVVAVISAFHLSKKDEVRDRILAAAPEQSSNGWNPDLKDPWQGNKVHTGYVTLESNPSKKIFYSYLKNKNNLTNAPVIIANTGGPGLSSQYALIWGPGPYEYDPNTNVISAKSKNHQLEFADQLLPEFPNGTGFAETDKFDSSIEELEATGQEFFEVLSKSEIPEEKEINIKSRKLIMYGMSYGCPLLAQLSEKLLGNGYNVQSLYLESPFINPISMVKKIPFMLKNFNIQTGDKLKKLEQQAEKCVEKIDESYQGKTWTKEDGELCNAIQDEPAFQNSSGVQLVNTTDMRCSKKEYLDFYLGKATEMWQTKNTQKVFGGNKVMQAQNFDVYTTLFYNTFNRSFDQYVSALLKKGVTISITVGNWDIIANNIVTEDWLSKLDYLKKDTPKNFDNTDWNFSQFGKKKEWNLLKYEVVEESGHIISLEQPEVPYVKLRELVGLSGKKRLHRRVLKLEKAY